MPALMNSSSTPRQLIIGVDAMEWDLVTRWTEAGKLPNLSRLLQQGTHAELTTIADSLPDASWQCLCSGLNPAHLARYFYVQNDPTTGAMRYLPDDSWGIKFFWDYLSEAGIRVGVIDIPHTLATNFTRGFQLSWGTHGLHGERFSTPPSMLKQVDEQFGRHPAGECDAANSRRARKAQLVRLLDGVKAHGELFRQCMVDHEWDVLMGVFSAPHCAGHMYWHNMDPKHPRHDPNDEEGLAKAIEEIYCAIDREIGALIEAAGPEVRVYVVSPLGMGPLYHASWNLPDLLEGWGFGSKATLDYRPQPRAASINPWRILRMIMPGKLQYAIYSMLPHRIREELMFRFYQGNRSWEGCRAFAVPNNDVTGAIRINLKGRDARGVVEPAEYDGICEEICAALAELIDPESGRPVAEHISRIHRELRGPHLDELPDITVQWANSFPWSALRSPRLGTMKIREQDSRSGAHTRNGFLIAFGDGIEHGAKLPASTSIYDFMPTIMKTAGVAIPAACEGRPLFTNQQLELSK